MEKDEKLIPDAEPECDITPEQNSPECMALESEICDNAQLPEEEKAAEEIRNDDGEKAAEDAVDAEEDAAIADEVTTGADEVAVGADEDSEAEEFTEVSE